VDVRRCAEAGYDPNAKDGNDESVLQLAVRQNNVEAVTELVSAGADMDYFSIAYKGGAAPLHIAAEEGMTGVMDALLRGGASVGSRASWEGGTPLHHAAGGGSAEAMNLLLEAGADPEARDGGGGTPLHHAAGGGSAEAVNLLLEAGADPEARDGGGGTPLHWAKRSSTIMALLAAGADIDALDNGGMTPLRRAVSRYDMRATENLLAAGACMALPYADMLEWRGSGGAAGRSDLMVADHESGGVQPGTDGFEGYLLRESGSGCVTPMLDYDHVYMVDTCLDSASGSIHSVLLAGAGQYSDLHVWSAGPATGNPVRHYIEGWADTYRDGRLDLVGPDGRCLWRERRSALRAVDDAMRALRMRDAGGKAFILKDGESLPVRPLAGETVRHLLEPLEGTATFEGAVYGNGADRADWRVIQVRGDAFCDAHGVVLVLNRRSGQWHSVYDIASGCTKTLDFPFYGMRVSDGHLTVSACYNCYGWGDYASYAIDLETWLVRRLDGPEDLLEWDPRHRENPPVTGIRQALSGD